MIRNMFLVVLLYLGLGGFIYASFLYQDHVVKTLEDITFYSSDSLGIECIGNENINNYAIDLLKYIFVKGGYKEEKIKKTIRSEALKKTLENINSAALAIVKNKDQEFVFKWAGPIFESYRYIYVLEKDYEKLKSNITNIDYIVVSGSFDETLLMENMVPKSKISYSKDIDEAINTVINGEKTGFVMSEDSCDSLLRQQKYSGVKLKKLYNLGLVHYYFAFNTGVPDNIIKETQKYIEEYKNTENYKEYVKQHKN